MTESATVVPRLPVHRPEGRPLDPPEEFAKIRARDPLARLTYPDGHLGWLVTGHAQTRAALADTRISNRFELAHHPVIPMGPDEAHKAPVGAMQGLDAPEHTRLRRILMGKFTVRRMALLTDRIREVTRECLAAMERAGSPTDLVDAFAWPIPATVVCELLGVPAEQRSDFKLLAASVEGDSYEESFAGFERLKDYLSTLALAKRKHPTDDVLGELARSELDDEELIGLSAFLLGAGLETTAKMLSLGTIALLDAPQQLAAWRADPGLTDSAVEELMRFLTVAHTDVRTAVADVEIDGHTIRAGETVTLSYLAANRDPARFADPDRLNLARESNNHVGFGHGAHQCLGQQLARLEMRIAFPALLARFPRLRLAAELSELRFVDGNVYGVERLPVAWED